MFPLYTGKDIPFHLSVRSTVLNISSIKSDIAETYKFPMILTLTVDVPHFSVQNG
jgi:hypothetical protein